MSTPYGRIADYFNAVAVLKAENDPAKQYLLAMLLGLLQNEKAVSKPKHGAREIERPVSGRERRSIPARSRDDSSSDQSSDQKFAGVSVEITFVRETTEKRPLWLETVASLSAPDSERAGPPRPKPLFRRSWIRGIITTAVSTAGEAGDVDVDAIVLAFAAGKVLRHVPRHVMPTMARGVQVLVDRGPACAPYTHDQEMLVQQIRAIAGRDCVQILRFDPTRGFATGIGTKRLWKSYVPSWRPPPGVVIVILSDLGIAPIALDKVVPHSEWFEFAKRLRGSGNSVVAFIPYSAARWPAILRRQMSCIPWDRSTTVQNLRKYLSESGRSAPRSDG
jgi:hypothetical protein